MLHLRHIDEIKTRFFYVLFSATMTFSICYLFCFELITLIARSFIHQPPPIYFIFTDLTEAFSTNLKICFISTVYLNFPAVLYQIWCFLIPSYYDRERTKITHLCFAMMLCVVLSCLFVHFILLPEICRFFINFSIQSNSINIQCEPRIYSYVSLVSNVFMISSLFFQIPILVFILFELKIITAGFLSKNRKYLIICSILMSAWITPPDILSEVALGTSLILFLELFILYIYITNVIRQRLPRRGRAATPRGPLHFSKDSRMPWLQFLLGSRRHTGPKGGWLFMDDFYKSINTARRQAPACLAPSDHICIFFRQIQRRFATKGAKHSEPTSDLCGGP